MEEAPKAGVWGRVLIEAVVGVDGRVTEARVLRSVPLLDQTALNAVRQLRYKVLCLNGVAVPQVKAVAVEFSPRAPRTPRSA